MKNFPNASHSETDYLLKHPANAKKLLATIDSKSKDRIHFISVKDLKTQLDISEIEK